MQKPEIHEHLMPWVDPEKTIDPTAIILHWWQTPLSRGGLELLDEIWKERGLASQFTVLADGSIYQLTPHENSFSRHAKCANNSGIGIEIQGEGEEDLDGNSIQFEAVVALTRYLKEKYHVEDSFRVENENTVAIRFYGITSHKNVDVYCKDANGKIDVHDAYLERVIQAMHY